MGMLLAPDAVGFTKAGPKQQAYRKNRDIRTPNMEYQGESYQKTLALAVSRHKGHHCYNAKTTPPRYKVRLNIGHRLERWIASVELIEDEVQE